MIAANRHDLPYIRKCRKPGHDENVISFPAKGDCFGLAREPVVSGDMQKGRGRSKRLRNGGRMAVLSGNRNVRHDSVFHDSLNVAAVECTAVIQKQEGQADIGMAIFLFLCFDGDGL